MLFGPGGLICTIGQIIANICTQKGFDMQTSGTIVSIILIGISAFLTGLNVFNKIGKFAGAGSLIPITGFANSIVSPAMDRNISLKAMLWELVEKCLLLQALYLYLVYLLQSWLD